MPSEAQKLSVTKLARMRNQSVVEVQQQLIERGYMEVKSGLHFSLIQAARPAVKFGKITQMQARVTWFGPPPSCCRKSADDDDETALSFLRSLWHQSANGTQLFDCRCSLHIV